MVTAAHKGLCKVEPSLTSNVRSVEVPAVMQMIAHILHREVVLKSYVINFLRSTRPLQTFIQQTSLK